MIMVKNDTVRKAIVLKGSRQSIYNLGEQLMRAATSSKPQRHWVDTEFAYGSRQIELVFTDKPAVIDFSKGGHINRAESASHNVPKEDSAS